MYVLVGSGEYLSLMEPIDQDLIRRLPEPARVVCLPTAAGTEGSERIDYWSKLGIDHFTRLGAKVQALPIVDHASANDPALAETIAGANFVYLSGGKPDYLYRSLSNTLAWQAIQEVLSTGGILAGCSAGAMIQGEKFFGFPSWKQGFNFLPGFTIIPHFDEISETMIRSIRLFMDHKLTILGIEGFTALVKTGEQYEVLGRGGVTVWNHAGKTRYTAGPLPLAKVL